MLNMSDERSERVGEGHPYREAELERPPSPRVSVLVVVAIGVSLLGDFALVAHLRDAFDGGDLMGDGLLAPAALLAVGAVLGIVAFKRVSVRDDLRGRRAAKAHLYAIGATALLVLAAPALPIVFIALYFLLGGSYTKGRPLVRRGRAVPIRPRQRRAAPRSSLYRRAIARHWLRAASYEHASVTAFEELRLQLEAFGGPRPLLARLDEAAEEERVHTDICLDLAQRYGAGAWSPGALPAPTPPDQSLAVLAVRQLDEGCMGEGYAAAVLAAGADGADPDVSERLRILAEDEARHAEDAWAILAFLCERGGDPVKRAVRRRARHLGRMAPRTRPWWLYAVDARREGLASRIEERRLYGRLRRQVRQRVEQLAT